MEEIRLMGKRELLYFYLKQSIVNELIKNLVLNPNQIRLR